MMIRRHFPFKVACITVNKPFADINQSAAVPGESFSVSVQEYIFFRLKNKRA